MGEALELTAAALPGEPWRLWTGHYVHFSAGHAAWNFLAVCPVLALLRRRSWLLVPWSLAAAPLISLLLLRETPAIEYRGASALVIGAWVIGGASALRSRRLRVAGLVVLLLVASKLILGVRVVGEIEPSATAHWGGAAAGLLAVLVAWAAGGLLGRVQPGHNPHPV